MKYAVAILIGIILTQSLGFYFYYNRTQETISVLTQDNVRLTTAVQLNEETIKRLQEDYASAQQEITSINNDNQVIRRQNARLVDKLRDHDIGLLAAEKPELVERLVNNGSNNALRCLELLSGSPLTERERNANSGTEFNNECPWLYDTLVIN